MNHRPLDKPKSFPRGSQSHVLPGLDPWQLASDPGGSPVFDFWDSVDVCDDLPRLYYSKLLLYKMGLDVQYNVGT